MLLCDELKKVFCRLVVYRVRIGNRAVLCFQFGFVSVVPPIVKQICRQVSVQLRAIPNSTATIVNKRNAVNPSAVVPADNRLNILFGKLLFKFLFAVWVLLLISTINFLKRPLKAKMQKGNFVTLKIIQMGLNERICIVGGGLSGLTLAYLLSQRNIRVTILEASPRLGGRIQTIQGAIGTPLELGATWFSDMHPSLLSLIDELGLKKYPQFSKGISLFQTKSFEPPQKFFIPEAEIPSYRLAGGTQMLIDTLAEKLPKENILLNTKVTAIKETEDGIELASSDGRKHHAGKVIICILPQLTAKQITFSPELPDALKVILPNVQTWMAGAIKFTLEYDNPFWRKEGYSGMLFSHAGIITEMYDHTNYEEDKFGFTGFLNGSAASYSQKVRKEFVLNQLTDLLGARALKPIAYFDKIWTDEFILAENQLVQRPHQNNGHLVLQQSYMDEKLFFSATETAKEFPGYMEGAVIAAQSVAERLIPLLAI